MHEPAATPNLSSSNAGALQLTSLAQPRARLWGAGWAVGGVLLMFAEAIFRLGLRALETVSAGLSPLEWCYLVIISAAFVYGEGYRALQKRFAPRVIERAFAIDVRRKRDVALAPLYALSLLGETPRVMARAYLAVALIVVAALLVSAMPFPWRGIVDGAVALALSWGAIALLAQFAAARRALSV